MINYQFKKMAITSSFAIIVALILIALANLCWFFLLPAKGESNPAVKVIAEIERVIRRSDDAEGANWSLLRKEIKKERTKLLLLSSSNSLSREQVHTLDKVLEALSLFVDGNWRLNEIGEDADQVKRFYTKSLKALAEIPPDQLVLNIHLEGSSDQIKQVNIGDSVSELKNLVQDQIQYIEETFGV